MMVEILIELCLFFFTELVQTSNLIEHLIFFLHYFLFNLIYLLATHASIPDSGFGNKEII